ncbi:MAG: cation diffusion facilitator family transporter [Bacteroidales bacterium]|nr:cation diffusion facilitator family transporter [Bacteroidales bacterium]
MQTDREKSIYRVTIGGFIVNVVLTVGKLFAGIVGRSGAMLADAIHSLSDFMTDLAVLVLVKKSSKPKDDSHDYGHGKYETLATVLIGIALFAVGVCLMINSIQKIVGFYHGEELSSPGIIALVAAFVSIVAKEILFWITSSVGKKVNSQAVIANAWHHRSDALSSVATLLGIGGAIFLGGKWKVLDPIAALIVSALIIGVAYKLFKPGLDELLESSLPQEMEDEIISEVMKINDGIADPHNLKTRRIGQNIAIEMHIRLKSDMTVQESHEITREIEKRLKAKYGEGTLIAIHVEPIK